ncbi:MAG: multidrug DMT transporter permease [Bacteroidetes bacterium]|nr:multidrug DMT transporter permease [Bacteroidota bacterium]
MFIVQSYPQAILFCVITMLCWGSWANTQKLAGRSWRFELFYWDYVIGILLFSLLSALSLGSMGTAGRPFMEDLAQADWGNIGKALIGGVVFNAANILLSAAIAIAGMAVAFPVGIGLALILGVLINYLGTEKGNPVLLFSGVGFVLIAILLNAAAYRRKSAAAAGAAAAAGGGSGVRGSSKGIVLSIVAGILMSFFYRFIAASMDVENFEMPAVGKMTPYTATFVFACGIFLSNFFFNTLLMRKPFDGAPVTYNHYFKRGLGTHMVGVLGGLIWGLGNALNLIAAGKAGPAISYGLGQGATLVAALWGVFIWKEFKGASAKDNVLLACMFLFFLLGLGFIIQAGQ